MLENMQLLAYFDLMWKDYCILNPDARRVKEQLEQVGENIVNDHVAFRTFSHPKVDISKLANHFLKFGYRQVAEYQFVEKKLTAAHFEHPQEDLPKVFISCLETQKCSDFLQKTVTEIMDHFDEHMTHSDNFLYAGRPWLASYEVYLQLSSESEYAAWVYAHGYRPNHFTVDINHLKHFHTVQLLNDFLLTRGFSLNTSGGLIKGSPSELLEQSSTLANIIPVAFKEGIFSIPGCYYEFAKRYPMKDGRMFQGFIAQSADKIFESTHTQRPS